jgi:hypothetical protein
LLQIYFDVKIENKKGYHEKAIFKNILFIKVIIFSKIIISIFAPWNKKLHLSVLLANLD